MQTLKTIVVDDSIIFRKVVRDCLASIPGVEIVGVAADGNMAVNKILQAKPDLVTLDVEMPGKNGLEVLQEIRNQHIETDIIMVSSQTDRAANVTTKALSLGAFDYILKPSQSTPEKNQQELLAALMPKVDAIRRRRQRRTPTQAPATPQRRPAPSRGVKTSPQVQRDQHAEPKRPARTKAATHPEVVVIGVSTGGPAALRQVLPKLPSNFPVPILIVQHMPPLFTASLARDLNTVCGIEVCEAEQGQPLRPGIAYIAPGGKHMRIAGAAHHRQIDITDDPPVRSCKPSVDYMFESASKAYGPAILAVVLTGMGNDGTEGCRIINKNGGRTIAQDEASCTVYGMPRQVIESGQADRIERLSDIPALLTRAVTKGASVCL